MASISKMEGFAGYLVAGAVLLIVLALLFFTLSPGLQGGFMLDDFPNLRTLERIDDTRFAPSFANVVLSGLSGALGRPLAMFSFALQYHSWPSDPYSFKYVNLMLHLLNGVLLFWLLWKIVSVREPNARGAPAVALITAVVWTVHPIQASTVFYVVQRMVELSATFTLMGLVLYAYGRELALRGELWRGYSLSTLGIVLCGGLAALSKETGILLPLYALVLEATLFAKLGRPRYWKIWSFAFLWLPTFVLIGYLGVHFDEYVLHGYALRNFSLGERLLTEARVVIEYLGQILLPRERLLGLFHDDYPVSHGLLDPSATLAAMLGLSLLAASAIAWRRRWPVYSFGVAWFLAGQLLESTLIPLELYFEHRNYLPSVGLLFVVVYAGWSAYGRLPGIKKAGVLVAGVGWVAALSLIAGQESRLWGQPVYQAIVWGKDHPQSLRAQQYAASAWLAIGEVNRAAAIYRALAQAPSTRTDGFVSWLAVGCGHDTLPLPNQTEVLEALRVAPYATAKGIVGAMESIVGERETGRCKRLRYAPLVQVFDVLLANGNLLPNQFELLVLLGRLHTAEGRAGAALDSFGKALAIRPDVEVALLRVKALVAAGRLSETAFYLEQAREINKSNRVRYGLYEKDIETWEAIIAKVRREKL
ncbi:MAG: tetratricopeptide repeat protein [Burkholderiales bacterium]